MSGLSPEARSILEAARDGDEPTLQDRKRVRASLIARIGAGFAAGTAATTAGSAAAGATKAAGAGLLASLLPKGLFVISAIGAVGLGAYVADRAEPPAPAAVPVVSAPVVAETASPVTPTEAIPAEPQDEEAEEAEAPTTPPVVAPSGQDASPHLAAEVESLREAHNALREGRADEAIEVLDRDAAPADSSGLEQEREAMRVFALCRLGKEAEARKQAESFLAKWPRSPHASRVRAACGE